MPLLPRLTEEELALLPHEDRGHDLLGVHWGLTSAATVFLLLRLYCKFFIKRNLWWDDWILIASWVGAVPLPQLHQLTPVSAAMLTR